MVDELEAVLIEIVVALMARDIVDSHSERN